MNIYKMDNEKLKKISTDFNNTMYGRRIWLFSRTPEIVGFISLVSYIILTIYGACNPDLKDTVSFFILANIIILGMSLILYGVAEVNYWKQVCKYANELEKEETAKKVNLEVKKSVKKDAAKTKKSSKDKPKK